MVRTKLVLITLLFAAVSCSTRKIVYKEQVAADRQITIYQKENFYAGWYIITANKVKSGVTMYINKERNCDTLYGIRSMPQQDLSKQGKMTRQTLLTTVSYDTIGKIPFIEEEHYLLRKLLEQREKDNGCRSSRLNSVTNWQLRSKKRS